MEELGSIFDYPHYISLTIIIIFTTMFTAIWAEKKRGGLKGSSGIFGFFVLIPVAVFHFIFLHLLPSSIIVFLVKSYLGGVEISAGAFATEYADPILKIALLLSIVGNFSDVASQNKRISFVHHSILFMMSLSLAYYGAMIITWILTKLIAAGGGFDVAHVKESNNLFSIPNLMPDNLNNIIAISVLIIILTLFSYWLTKYRRPIVEEEKDDL